MPTVRLTSWPLVVPQLIIFGVLLTIGAFLASAYGLFLACGLHLAYSWGSRAVLARAHRRGIRLSSRGLYEAAIAAYQESYSFFTRHRWLDRYRAVTLLMPSAMSYREMALVNTAACYVQLGDGKKAKEYYSRALAEFPGSALAASALKLIESVEAGEMQ
jgi:tetratricopeptide (TPR) repeat protein